MPQLTEYFIKHAARRRKLSLKNLADDALRSLLDYDYPGNVRVLENMIERAMVTSGAGSLPTCVMSNETKKQFLEKLSGKVAIVHS